MNLAAELSLYPLDGDYIPYIKDFIDRLNGHSQLQVRTTETNTLVVGQFSDVMAILADEMHTTYQQLGQAIFVCKFLNADKANIDLS
jgi:uncharacterized protein YqgV (UPF0045/DUF77 family)